MPRLAIIALLTAVTFFGALIVALGVHFWFAAHPTVQTLLDSHVSDPDSIPFDQSDALFDKAFILHRFAAVLIFVIGLCIIGWVARLMLRKDPSVAT